MLCQVELQRSARISFDCRNSVGRVSLLGSVMPIVMFKGHGEYWPNSTQGLSELDHLPYKPRTLSSDLVAARLNCRRPKHIVSVSSGLRNRVRGCMLCEFCFPSRCN